MASVAVIQPRKRLLERRPSPYVPEERILILVCWLSLQEESAEFPPNYRHVTKGGCGRMHACHAHLKTIYYKEKAGRNKCTRLHPRLICTELMRYGTCAVTEEGRGKEGDLASHIDICEHNEALVPVYRWIYNRLEEHRRNEAGIIVADEVHVCPGPPACVHHRNFSGKEADLHREIRTQIDVVFDIYAHIQRKYPNGIWSRAVGATIKQHATIGLYTALLESVRPVRMTIHQQAWQKAGYGGGGMPRGDNLLYTSHPPVLQLCEGGFWLRNVEIRQSEFRMNMRYGPEPPTIPADIQAVQGTTVFVDRPCWYVSDAEIWATFEVAGPILEVTRFGFISAFIKFSNHADAFKAINWLQGYILGNNRLRLSWPDAGKVEARAQIIVPQSDTFSPHAVPQHDHAAPANLGLSTHQQRI